MKLMVGNNKADMDLDAKVRKETKLGGRPEAEAAAAGKPPSEMAPRFTIERRHALLCTRCCCAACP